MSKSQTRSKSKTQINTTFGLKDAHLTGGYIPQAIADQFSLYVLYHRVSRSSVLRELITKWLSSETMSTNDIVNKLSERVYESWIHDGAIMGAQIAFTQYCQKAREVLVRKKLSENHIKTILERARRLHETHDKKWAS
jgi:Arc/MetJ-type ribon-helix-helix transcriptional regulator